MSIARLVLQTATVSLLAVLVAGVSATPVQAQASARIQARARVLSVEPARDGLVLAERLLAARRTGRKQRRLATVEVMHERKNERRAPLVRVDISYLRN